MLLILTLKFQGRSYSVSVYPCYRNGTAFGGDLEDLRQGSCDFLEVTEQKLEFGKGETSKGIKLRVNPNSKVHQISDNFIAYEALTLVFIICLLSIYDFPIHSDTFFFKI